MRGADGSEEIKSFPMYAMLTPVSRWTATTLQYSVILSAVSMKVCKKKKGTIYLVSNCKNYVYYLRVEFLSLPAFSRQKALQFDCMLQ